jgi:hypothetical protein
VRSGAMSQEASLRRLLTCHRRLRFPDDLAGQAVDGQYLLLLDSEAAGCIQCFFAGKKRMGLDGSRVRILEKCTDVLARVCPQLAEDHRPYFESLRALTEGIVRYCHRPDR